jgi:SAM-dependent methyltransferase
MAAPLEIDWYDTPLWYDMIFDVDTPKEADFLERAYEVHADVPRKRESLRVLEPACGSGRLVVELARRGHRVTGNDLSRPMLDYAEDRLGSEGLKAKLVQGDMAQLGMKGPFDIAHCLVSTFKYLLTEADTLSHLRSVAECLVTGGIYCLGFHLSDYDRVTNERERWDVERDGARVICNIQGWPPDKKRRREKVRSRLRVDQGTGAGEQVQETVWEFRTYDAAEVRHMLAQVPEFEHVATHTFQYDLDETLELEEHPFDVLLILRKR